MSDSETLASVCRLLSQGSADSAGALLGREMPFQPVAPVTRKCTQRQALGVFRRDGFLCRYSGERLIFPGTLRLLSVLWPEQFPYHTNWKMGETHLAYWRLYPTVDHVVPVARGGPDDTTNWVTTSQLRNSAKSNWLLGELGWTLRPAGDLRDWDGLSGWFLEYVEAHPDLLKIPAIKSWYHALRRANLESSA